MTKKRGRPKTKVDILPKLDFSNITLIRGSELNFKSSLFDPFKTNREIDLILSTEGGLMPGTNMAIAGGPGSGKTTLVLDVLSSLTQKGYKCLYVSAEMDEIAHFKYCKRIPKFSCIQTLFLKNYAFDVKDVLEYVFNLGYDVIAIDSIAEVIDMFKDKYKTTESTAESWFLSLQDKMKKGYNSKGYNTSFINIQQFTKAGEMAGSNRLKHMVDAYALIDRSKDGLERSIHFTKNRDCDKDYKIYFSIWKDGVQYAMNQEE